MALHAAMPYILGRLERVVETVYSDQTSFSHFFLLYCIVLAL